MPCVKQKAEIKLTFQLTGLLNTIPFLVSGLYLADVVRPSKGNDFAHNLSL